MSEKERILEAWEMIEHLTEGSLKEKDNSLIKLSEAENGEYHRLFSRKLEAAMGNDKTFEKQGGIILYLDIFKFSEVIDLLRKKYHLKAPEEEKSIGIKFGLAVCFNSQLKLLPDMTFFTKCEYIRLFGDVPDLNEFLEYEKLLQTEIAQKFSEPEEKATEYSRVFNDAVKALLEKLRAVPEKCSFKVLDNLRSQAANLHSFYLNDLETARDTYTDNLNDYLFGYHGSRIDLDSKNDSPKFNPEIFKQILEPRNYPLGRFPSNTEYSLSFMQQVAVNLATGCDGSTIRSVNGPPGTGKTTLLKDIFAELIVRQAADIISMRERTIQGSSANKYYKDKSIGELPEKLAENEIIVASSNNGAVQNIVNEIPLKKDIDPKLAEELENADYFKDLANSRIKLTDGKTEIVENSDPDKYWGLFSLEGGRSENMSKITANIKAVVEYLETEYVSRPEVYEEFRQEYDNVVKQRQSAQEYSERLSELTRGKAELDRLEMSLPSYSKKAAADSAETNAQLEQLKQKSAAFEAEIGETIKKITAERTEIEKRRDELSKELKELISSKPGFFSPREKKQEHKRMMNDADKRKNELIRQDREAEKKENTLREYLMTARQQFKNSESALTKDLQKINSELQQYRGKIEDLKSTTARLQSLLPEDGKPLDMSLEYDKLQLSNPWFGEEYRKAQSRLFISALKVRKQFLYENRSNVEAARNIWSHENKYSDKRALIYAAWHWINFTIPAISSTFASFGRMCRNIGKNALGRLFIDEAGQALPQAAVGAVMRSKDVMVLGDPSQIKPVLSLDEEVLKMLREHFKVNEKYISENSSAQTLVDAAGKYGYYYADDRSEDSWIGIPLWVHRRCQYPMFTIANEISYRGRMVQGKEMYGRAGWLDVKGRSDNENYVREQGSLLVKRISEMMKNDPGIGDKDAKDTVYVITPFRHISEKLASELSKIGFTRYKDGKPSNIGTVHTFQGKEAPIVFLVLGADDRRKPSANWAVSEPNLMNVAATRAKNEFYIIGDRELYAGLKKETIEKTLAVLNIYGKEHPELTESETIQTKAAAPAERLSGTVAAVRKCNNGKYAEITGSNGLIYTIADNDYRYVPNADSLIAEGAELTFICRKVTGKRRYVDAKSVRKA